MITAPRTAKATEKTKVAPTKAKEKKKEVEAEIFGLMEHIREGHAMFLEGGDGAGSGEPKKHTTTCLGSEAFDSYGTWLCEGSASGTAGSALAAARQARRASAATGAVVD